MEKYIYYNEKEWVDTLSNITIPKGRISFLSDVLVKECTNPYIKLNVTEEQIKNINDYVVSNNTLVKNTVVSDYMKVNTSESLQQRVDILEKELNAIKTMGLGV